MTSTTSTTPARTRRPSAASRKAAATQPATVAGQDAALLAGVTKATSDKPATAKARGRKTQPEPTPAPARKDDGKAAARTALAVRIIQAIGEAVASAPPEVLAAIGGIDEAMRLTSAQVHHLPVGKQWPTGKLPVPARSEWDAKTGAKR